MPSRKTLLSTRIPLSGICTAWVWLEWGPYKPTPLTGEQPVTTRPMASISPITSVVTLRTLTLWNILMTASRAGKWSLWISVGTWVFISPHVFGRVPVTFYTSTAARPAAISTRRPAQCQVKITLVIMQPSTTSSVAQRGIFPPPSGGLVPICKRQWHAPKGLQNDRRRLSTHKYSFCKLDVGNKNVIFGRLFNKDWDLQELSVFLSCYSFSRSFYEQFRLKKTSMPQSFSLYTVSQFCVCVNSSMLIAPEQVHWSQSSALLKVATLFC